MSEAVDARSRLMEVRDLSFAYGRETILDRVDLDILRGDFLAIIGPNGGGKSTLIKILLGLLAPESGEIRSHLSGRRGCRGYVPQFATFEAAVPLRVKDVVLMGRLGRRGPLRRYSRSDREAVHAILGRLHLTNLYDRPIAELSGGEIQRVLIARALAGEPEILFLDEPTASIDVESRETLRELLLELNREMPIVIVTHDLTSLPDTVQNIACLNRQLYYHASSEIPEETLEKVYGCHVDLIAHGHPHRVLGEHAHSEPDDG